jgi:hypothetical protein
MFESRDVLCTILADEADYSAACMRFMKYNTRTSEISQRVFLYVIYRSSNRNASLHVGCTVINMSSDANNIGSFKKI